MEREAPIRFGPFELDAACFALRRDGVPVDVQGKALDLILYLLRERHRVVTPEELMAALWPDAAVTEASLRKAVRTARRTLGDDARAARFVETVRGRGLRFIAPVEGVDEAASGTLPHPTTGFVGRDQELAAIDAAVASAASGRGRLVLLEGEAGIGKTRTAQEAVRRAEARGIPSAVGWCLEREATPTLFPFAECVRAWAEAADEARLDTLRAALSAAAPDIGAVVGGRLGAWDAEAGPRRDPPSLRERRVEGFARLLGEIVRTHPLLVVLDDMHRADGASLAVLDRLAPALSRLKLALLLTYRPGELSNDSSLPGLARRPEAVPLRLAGLSREETGRLVAREGGASTPAHRVDRIHALSGGNPFFICELARGEDAALEAEPVSGTLPAPIRHVLATSLARLPGPVRELLVHAAVAGREVDAGWLARALGCPVAEVTEGLDSAADAGCLSRRGARFAFGHELVRRAAVEELSAAELAAVRYRLGEALLARTVDAADPLRVRAAQHLCRGAAAGDAEHAVQIALGAGEAAAARGAHEDAAEILGLALDALDLVEAPDPAIRLRLLLDQGEARVVTGELGAGRALLRRAVAMARELGNTDDLARAAVAFGGLSLSPEVTYDPELIAFLAEVQRELPDRGSTEAVRIAVRLGAACTVAGRAVPPDVVEVVEEAARVSADPTARFHALYGRRWTLVETRHLPTRCKEADHMLDLARSIGSGELELAARSCRFLDRLELGRSQEADAELEAYAALADAEGVARYRYRTLLYRAARATLDGRLSEAEGIAARALEEARRIGSRDAERAYQAVLLTRLREQGRFDEIRRLAAGVPESLPTIPVVRPWQVAADLETDGPSDALRARVCDVASALVASEGRILLRMPGFVLLGDAAERLDLADVAADLLAALEPLAGRIVVLGAGVAVWGALDRTIAGLAATVGDLEGAVERLEAARALEQRAGAWGWLAWTESMRARLLERRGRPGDREQAQRARAGAAETARQLQLVRLQRCLES